MYATNDKLLTAVNQAIQTATDPDDPRVRMLALMFLHSNPDLNSPGMKYTPLHIALDKQSPQSLEIMLDLLKGQRRVCVTSQLLDRLENIIAQNSSIVNEFFESAFFITDQYLETNALDWTLGEDKEEHWVCVPTSFLTLDYLQSIVRGDEETKDLEDQDE